MKQTEINKIWGERLMQTKYLFYFLLVSALMFTIAGCGGGDGGGGASGATISSVPDDPPPPSSTGSVTLAWDAPTTNTDDSPYTDPGGYIVYYGTSSGNYAYSSNIGNFTSSTISNLASGTWYFAVKAVNSVGNQSAYSAELSLNVS